MELAIYSKANYNSAFEASISGAIYHVRDLQDIRDTATLEDVNGDDMCNAEAWMHIQTTENALEATGTREDYVFIMVDGETPKFELVKTEALDRWTELDSQKFRNEESAKILNDGEYEVNLIPSGNGTYIVIFTDKNGVSVEREGVELGDEFDITLGNETFAFVVKYMTAGDYTVDMYNLTDTGTNRDFNFEFVAVVAPTDYILKRAISKELENIEKWSEVYCGPLCNGTGADGDDIYQAVHSIRKLIGIGFEDYDKEVARANEIESLEIVDGSLMSCHVDEVGAGDNEYGFFDSNLLDTIVERDFDQCLEAEHAMKEYVIKTYIDPKYN